MHQIPMTRLCAALLALSLAGAAAAQDDAQEPLAVRPTHVRLGLEKVKLPGGESVGLVGASYLLDIGHGFAAGPTVHGAVTGRRGGLFVLGAQASWRHRFGRGPISLETGLFAGAGGGGGAPTGNGLMLRPHLDLLWDFGRYRAGISLSQVRFAHSGIDSRQLGLVWTADSDFRYVPPERIGTNSITSGRSGVGVDRVQAVVGSYFPASRSKRVDGTALPSKIGLIGARFEQSLGGHPYWGIEAGGAASGGVAGYAELLATLGTEALFWDRRVALGARAALGMGGGGGVDTGGGLLAKGSVYGTLRLSRDVGLTLEGGVATAPNGSFRASFGAASLTVILDDPYDVKVPARTTRTEWALGVERSDALRRDGSTRPMKTIALKVNRFMTDHAYLTGQTRSAFSGDAGGHVVGLIGAGARVPFGSRWHASAEMLVGTGGGGNVDTRGGALVQPTAYVGFDITPAVALRVSAGRLKSIRGDLDSSTVGVGMTFSFGVASRGFR